MGGYLTFAAHAHFTQSSSFHDVKTRGIELRGDLVAETNGIAADLGPEFEGLRFQESSIAEYLTEHNNAGGDSDRSDDGDDEKLVLITLHACDTATDDALWAGIQNRAETIITAPCCHKEVRAQLNALVARGFVGGEHDQQHDALQSAELRQRHPLASLLRFGTYRERAAEMATDAMRALLLEIA